MSQLNSANDLEIEIEQDPDFDADSTQPAPTSTSASPSVPTPRPDVPTQKQKTNVYTVMLIISFICIVIACILLFWELTLWGDYPWWNTDQSRPITS